ncbi:phosphate ABC transporter substrate-binding protein [Pelagibaculum spongiae]|uniref:Phosphate ABC transporter substrate-binding protein n=1 Tax=Pelagibaculum spongiae TaxID=2080658 RepID=A0A2V1GWL1_9GAMM|nr:phosphate ABC transporter substrate-binding protein [Pelagibaculum spongiae]PVZ71484.1 phosphate ABC transporter substrate-binding protein [Pelagibaculum spongiae]
MYKRILALALLGAATTSAMAEVALIAHPGMATSYVTQQEVARLYMGKLRTLPGSGRLKLINLPAENPTYKEFYSKVVGVTPSQAKSAWSRLIFTGKARAPKEMVNAKSVVDQVAEYPGYIGYVDASMVDSRVKVLLKVE